MNSKIRTVVEFWNHPGGGFEPVRVWSIDLKKTIPNVVVGQTMAFNHPQMDRCISGKVTNIQHGVFLDPKDLPITYIDVTVN